MNPTHNNWWNYSLSLIKRKGDFLLSREMNWISKEIIARKGFEKLEAITSEISDQLVEVENELLR